MSAYGAMLRPRGPLRFDAGQAVLWRTLALVSCPANRLIKSRRIFRSWQGARTPCGRPHTRTSNTARGKKDQRIDALVQKQSAVIPPAVKTEIDGYRIQLVFDGNKDVVNNARSKFISKYPKVDTYIEFNAPNFILKAGDFRTKLEAEKIKADKREWKFLSELIKICNIKENRKITTIDVEKVSEEFFIDFDHFLSSEILSIISSYGLLIL